jgi:hypothetical protein
MKSVTLAVQADEITYSFLKAANGVAIKVSKKLEVEFCRKLDVRPEVHENLIMADGCGEAPTLKDVIARAWAIASAERLHFLMVSNRQEYNKTCATLDDLKTMTVELLAMLNNPVEVL